MRADTEIKRLKPRTQNQRQRGPEEAELNSNGIVFSNGNRRWI